MDTCKSKVFKDSFIEQSQKTQGRSRQFKIQHGQYKIQKNEFRTSANLKEHPKQSFKGFDKAQQERNSTSSQKSNIQHKATGHTEEQDMEVVCEKLIEVFLKSKEEEWKKIILYSQNFVSFADIFFTRLEKKARKCSNPDHELRLYRMLNRVKQYYNMKISYDRAFTYLESHEECEWADIITNKYQQLILVNTGFIDYLQVIINTAALISKDKHQQQIDRAQKILGIIKQNSKYQQLDLQSNVDNIIQAQQENLHKQDQRATGNNIQTQKLLSSQVLQESGSIDFSKIKAKMFQGNKESPYNEEDVMDVTYQNYMDFQKTKEEQLPKEIRILKYLLQLDGQLELEESLEQAFEEQQVQIFDPNVEYLSTKPILLFTTIDTIVQTYEKFNAKTSILSDNEVMSPEVMQKMKSLANLIKKKYL